MRHTSGQAPVKDLQRLVEAMNPERVDVERHADGDWWAL
jgi:hypothetical protein